MPTNFIQENLEYLTGEKFSNGKLMKVAAPESKVVYRLDYLEELVRGSKVLHVGFADHVPLIAEKIKKNEWLHKRLVESAGHCLGIDIDEEAIGYIRNTYGYDHLLNYNLLNDTPSPEIKSGTWDYMIMGEILEHIDNPVLFLSQIYKNYGENIKHLVITVPNAFSLANARLLKNNIEYLNTDHRYWFSPYTLAKVVSRAGWKPHMVQLCEYFRSRSIARNFLLRRLPVLRNSIILICNNE
jgi:hypothetical protein